MLESGGFTEFKLDFYGTKNLCIGDVVRSDDFSVGGHVWRVNCFPYGEKTEGHGAYVSLFLQLVSDSKNDDDVKVKAIFECFVMARGYGEASLSHSGRCMNLYSPDGFPGRGFPWFVRRYHLERSFLTDGFATFMIGVIVVQQRERDNHPIPVPPSDIAGHLGRLLDHAAADGTDTDDVAFSVAGEMFRAHRAVLAARSPVFKAQLFGAMADATMRCITLHDISPATFRALLRFIYTDELPMIVEEESSTASADSYIDSYLGLLAAADMYQLDRLRLLCAHRLWERVSPETVAKVLCCAEMHNCPELKRTCLDFFVVEKNFKIAVLTEGYLQLMQSFPSIINEIRGRVQTSESTKLAS